MKKCEYCEKEINLDADYCVYCGKKQETTVASESINVTPKKTKKNKDKVPAWAIVLMILSAVGVILLFLNIILTICCLSNIEELNYYKYRNYYDYDYDYDDDNDTDDSDDTNNEDKENDSKFDDNKLYNIGDTISYNGLSYKVTDYKTIERDSNYNYILVNVSIENKDNKRRYYNSLYFSLDDRTNNNNKEVTLKEYEDKLLKSGYIDANETKTGLIIFEENKDYKDLTLVYYNSIIANDPKFEVILSTKTI